MSNTANLGLPLLAPAQAQKHVTVNEALVLLDGLGQITLQTLSQTDPPAVFDEGECYAIRAAATGSWLGHEGDIAIASNGGWVFATPAKGWRAFVIDLNGFAVWDGQEWQADVVAISSSNATTAHRIVEIDHTISGGPTSVVTGIIPANSTVLGVTGRVQSAFAGSATTWRIGVSGADDRYGSGLGLAQGSWLRGLTASPLTYYAPTDMIVTGEGGDIDSGILRLAVHLIELDLPD